MVLAVLLGSLWASGLAASPASNRAGQLTAGRSLLGVEAAVPPDRAPALRPSAERPDLGGRLVPPLLGMLAAALAAVLGLHARRLGLDPGSSRVPGLLHAVRSSGAALPPAGLIALPRRRSSAWADAGGSCRCLVALGGVLSRCCSCSRGRLTVVTRPSVGGALLLAAFEQRSHHQPTTPPTQQRPTSITGRLANRRVKENAMIPSDHDAKAGGRGADHRPVCGRRDNPGAGR